MNLFKSKITLSITVIIISFLIFIISLYFAKPLYVTEISDKGEKKISYPLLISLSFLFGLFFGIIAFFMFPNKNSPPSLSKESPVHRFVNYNF
jgi:hypothetical protein